MRKIFTLITTFLLSVLAAFSQPQLPDGYVSVYSLMPETELAPLTIDGGASYQLLGPANGWGDSTNYDLSSYEKLAFKITFDPADAGHQMAVRFSVNGTGAQLHVFTLPTEGTSVVEEINLADYADTDGKVLFGGIVLYNGATHWSFSYDGTAASQACTIDYVALKEQPSPVQLPEGYVSIYSLMPETELAPLTIDGGASSQLLGPASGWGDSTNYDLSSYEKLAFKITFDPADAGHQMAIRFSVNGTGAQLHVFTLPTDGTTTVEEINLADYADADGKVLVGGIVFYNGASHWSFSYDGTAATQACTIDYVALKEQTAAIQIPDGYVSVYSIKPETEMAPLTIDGGASYQLLGPANGWGESTEYDFSDYEKLSFNITFDPADAGHQMAIRFSVNGTGAQLHVFTLPTEGTTAVEEINLADYADTDGKVLFGGIVFYNGATHWSFSYDGTAATQACKINYVALKEKPAPIQLPDGYVSVYSIKPETEMAPLIIDGGVSYQLLGPANGWGESTEYDFSDYDKLAFKITFDPADAGHQMAIRFSVNNTGAKLHLFTLPTEGTTAVEEINLADYADADGKVLFGGIVFYNGATHWSFSYDGTAASQACTIDYVALKEKLQLPEGYVSFYSVNLEEERAPVAIAGGKSLQLAGPSDWGNSTEYDLSAYDTLSFKITFDPADAGNQMAIRFNVNSSVKLQMVTLPEEGTSVVININLSQYADEDGNAILGGIVFYNGATHWSFSYDEGKAATHACVINYIALKKKPDIDLHKIPEGYVSVYSIMSETELVPLALGAWDSYQLLGSPENWGSSLDYDFSNYEKLAVQVAYDSIDAGKEVAFRFSVDGWTYLHLFTLPTDGTLVMEEINLADYADADGKVLVGGIVFYNGADHWSFSYTDPSTQPVTIDFVALKPSTVTGVNEVKMQDPNALVNVYSITGVVIRQNVRYSEATIGLRQGLYIVGNKKVYITR